MSPQSPRSTSFRDLKDWVNANEAKNALEHYPPASTNWEHQVAFYTKNAEPCSSNFRGYKHCFDDVACVDRASGMKLMHGFVCFGKAGNNSYSTTLMEDFEPLGGGRRKLDDVVKKQICENTLGVKYYFFRPTKEHGKHPLVEYEDLVVVAMSLRVGAEGEVVCLTLQLKTSLYYAGGHGGGTFCDASYKKYTKFLGWNAKPWCGDSFGVSPNREAEQKFHKETVDRLIQSLC